jgi:hypothetical protein
MIRLARVAAPLSLAAAVAVAIAVIAPAPTALAKTARPAVPGSGSQGSFHVPYSDPSQAGLLTLCNKANQPVTHGTITAKPFVWRVVSSVATPNGYWVKGATATLYAYQPRQYTPAGAWSGLAMTAASVYSNPATPMVQSTPIDEPLSYMTESFPPLWDGLIELRMYLGGPDLSEYNDTYGVADLQIKGNTWTMVEGGDASCTTGTAISREVILGLPGASGTSPSPAVRASGAAGQGSGSSGLAGNSGHSSAASPQSATEAAARSSGVGLGAVVGFSALAAALILATAGIWWRRRRRAGL